MLKQEAGKPQVRLQMMTNELGEFMKAIRDPLIEAFTAAVILYFLRPLLPSIETAVVITLIVIITVFIITCVFAVVLWNKGNELLRMHRSIIQNNHVKTKAIKKLNIRLRLSELHRSIG